MTFWCRYLAVQQCIHVFVVVQVYANILLLIDMGLTKEVKKEWTLFYDTLSQRLDGCTCNLSLCYYEEYIVDSMYVSVWTCFLHEQTLQWNSSLSTCTWNFFLKSTYMYFLWTVYQTYYFGSRKSTENCGWTSNISDQVHVHVHNQGIRNTEK